MTLQKYILEYVERELSKLYDEKEFKWIISFGDAKFMEKLIRTGIRKEIDTKPETQFRLYYAKSSVYYKVKLLVDNKSITQVFRMSNHKYKGTSETTAFSDETPTFFINGWESREYIIEKIKEFINRTILYFELKYRESRGEELTKNQQALIREAEHEVDNESYFIGQRYISTKNKIMNHKQFPIQLELKSHII